MAESAKTFLLDRVLTYYEQNLMPELNRFGVRGDRLIPLLKELALEISPKITLDQEQQQEFLEQVVDIAIEIFEGERSDPLKVYKTELKLYLN